jgi:hypothetical protein
VKQIDELNPRVLIVAKDRLQALASTIGSVEELCTIQGALKFDPFSCVKINL